jgi:hypothetical protein
LGKYLKLIYEAHEKANTLDSMDINADGSLDVFDFWVQCFYLPENVIAAISEFKGQIGGKYLRNYLECDINTTMY